MEAGHLVPMIGDEFFLAPLVRASLQLVPMKGDDVFS